MRKVVPVMIEDGESLKQRVPRERQVARNRDATGSICWRVGKPRHAQTWRSCWESIARPLATGSVSTRRGAWRPCWRGMSQLVHPSRCPPTSWPPLRMRSGSPLAWPPTKPCASGSIRPTTGRSMITPSTPSSAPSSKPSSRSHGLVTPKNPEAIAAFQATCRERLPRVLPPDHTRPIRVFSQDESRFGVLTVRRRRLTARGVQPVGLVPHTFEWFYVYRAVAPTTGERFCLEWPYLTADACQFFVDEFAHALPNCLNIRLLDHSCAHTAQRLQWPEHVQPVWLPPYGPELNPIERLWRDLKDDRAWLHCPNLEAPQISVGDVLQAYEALALQALTSDAYLGEAMNALVS